MSNIQEIKDWDDDLYKSYYLSFYGFINNQTIKLRNTLRESIQICSNQMFDLSMELNIINFVEKELC